MILRSHPSFCSTMAAAGPIAAVFIAWLGNIQLSIYFLLFGAFFAVMNWIDEMLDTIP